jgi:hypothetical protein
MAKLELKLENVREHGFPYACMLCGSDESPKPRKTTFRSGESGLGYGCALFLGPIGWTAALVYFLVNLARRKHSFAVPVCDCCHDARLKLRKRDLILLGLGIGLFAFPFGLELGTFGGWTLLGGIILMLAAAFEQATYQRQFQLRTLKTESDRVLLSIPNEDYPSMYQRHLDTAVLYGCVESMGTEA